MCNRDAARRRRRYLESMRWGIAFAVASVGCGAPVMPALVDADAQADPAAVRCGDVSYADVPVEALVVDGVLWVRGAGGSLASLPLRGRAGITRHLDGERVLDLHHASRGALWALTLDEGPGDVRVWRRGERGWAPIWQMGAPETTVALLEIGGAPALLATGELYVSSTGLATRALAPELPRTSGYAAVASGRSVWVTSRGAGWLYRVDAETGQTALVADRQGEACGGLLDPACDVIVDLMADPGDADCVLVAARGRVVRACAGGEISLAPTVAAALRSEWVEEVRALAFLFPEGSPSRVHLLSLSRAENPGDLARPSLVPNLPPYAADSVVALAASGAGYVALGRDALYRIDAERFVRSSLPPSEPRCGLSVARAGASVIVGGMGPLPLVAALDAPPPQSIAVAPPEPPPCDDTVIFYARGVAGAEDSFNVVISCSAGAVTLTERARPEDRVFSVPPRQWQALWADLERASWRTWKSCDPVEHSDTAERFVISSGADDLQVDCPAARLDAHQRAVLERLRSIADATTQG
jgi:hypothetical protein